MNFVLQRVGILDRELGSTSYLWFTRLWQQADGARRSDRLGVDVLSLLPNTITLSLHTERCWTPTTAHSLACVCDYLYSERQICGQLS
jgi:hypothetical protein